LNTSEGIQTLVAAMTTGDQQCDILINNAGCIHFGQFQDQSAESVETMYQTNLISPVMLMQALLPSMLARQSGMMVCMGSALGAIGYPFHSVASSCKFGLRGFCQALRRELEGSGVQVAYVAPRTTRTSMNSDIMLDMAKALGNAVDEPETVADAVIDMIERDQPECIIGKPERLFAKLNAVFPSLVDRALSKQHQQMKGYATKHLKLVKESDIIKTP
jgi:short-subunit dehydrogenase